MARRKSQVWPEPLEAKEVQATETEIAPEPSQMQAADIEPEVESAPIAKAEVHPKFHKFQKGQ